MWKVESFNHSDYINYNGGWCASFDYCIRPSSQIQKITKTAENQNNNVKVSKFFYSEIQRTKCKIWDHINSSLINPVDIVHKIYPSLKFYGFIKEAKPQNFIQNWSPPLANRNFATAQKYPSPSFHLSLENRLEFTVFLFFTTIAIDYISTIDIGTYLYGY